MQNTVPATKDTATNNDNNNKKKHKPYFSVSVSLQVDLTLAFLP